MAIDRLQSMRVFVAAVAHGSFRATAESLRMSTAMVSIHVAQLEDHLGVRLLNRTTRVHSLTEDGAAYHAHCVHLLGEIDEIEAGLAEASQAPRGWLRIDTPTSIGKFMIMPLLGEFRRRYPDIHLEISFSEGVQVEVNNEFDLMIRIGPLKDSSLTARPLGQVRSVLAASPDYLARCGEPRSPDDLAKHNVIKFMHPESRKLYELVFRIDGKMQRVVTNSDIVLTEHDMRTDAAAQGLGLTQSLTIDVADAVRQGRLQLVLREYELKRIPVYALYKQGRRLPARLRAFLDFLAEYYPSDVLVDPLTDH